MEKIISILVMITANQLTQSKAINSGFTLFNPIFVKEDIEPETSEESGAHLTKIPQNPSKNGPPSQEFLFKAFSLHSSELGVGCTNQMAKILFPPKLTEMNTTTEIYDKFIKIPILRQPFPDYKIVVATAPWNMKIRGEKAKPAVVYIVFPEDDEDSSNINIPAIYFVKKSAELLDLKKKDKIDPVIVINSNRTVTGLKSKEVAKFIKFRNRLINTDTYYAVTR